MHLNGWYKSGVSIKLYVWKGEIFWFFVKINFPFSNTESTPKLLNISIDLLSPWVEFGKLQINDVEVVSKSYPDYWQDFKKAGFIISLLSD